VVRPGGGSVAPGGRTSTVGMAGAGQPGGLPQQPQPGASGAPPQPAAAATALTALGQIDPKVQNVAQRHAQWYANLGMLAAPDDPASYKNAYEMTNPEATIAPNGQAVNLRDPNVVGQNFQALPQGMQHDPTTGQIVNMPGYVNAQTQRTLADQAAQHYLTPVTTEANDGSQTTTTQGGNLYGLAVRMVP
jgi:hypothetical protein